MGDLLQRKVTASIRKAIRDLRQRASQLEEERLQLAEERQCCYDDLERNRAAALAKQPIAEQIFKPIAELHSRATLNFLETKELKRMNRILQDRIDQVEEELARPAPTTEEYETSATRAETIVRDYQLLFAGFATAPPLPFPYSSHFLAQAAIAPADKIALKDSHRIACAQMASFPGDFNTLSMADKRKVMQLLKDLRLYALEIIEEIKKTDAEMLDKFRHDARVNASIARYTLIRLSMEKVRFTGPL
jgi:hypothetical protein